MRAALLKHILHPSWHWIKGDGVNRALKEANANQWLSTSELRVLQEKKLAQLIAYARKHVPYYRRHLININGQSVNRVDKEEFSEVPILTKKIIQQEYDSLVSEDLAGNKLMPNSTSGSTGEPLRFYTDTRSAGRRKAALIRSDSWTGWQLGERIVRLWGAPMDEKLGTSLRGKLHAWVTGDKFLSSSVLSDRKMSDYANIIRNFQPSLLIAYPGPLEQFAIYCRENRIKFNSLHAIVSSAETLWPHQRETIESAFEVKIFNRYGSREVSQIASECSAHDGLHISSDRLFVEVINENGEPCAFGESGFILVTDLDNYGMPLIRYEIGDQGTLIKDTICSCGRGFPKIGSVEGRTMDIIRTVDGRCMGGTFWTLLLRKRPGIRKFQVTQTTLDGIVIRFIRDDDFKEEVLDYFRQKIKEVCGQNFAVEFEERERIDETNSGKQRIILSELPKEFASTPESESV